MDGEKPTRTGSGHVFAALYFVAATVCLVGPAFAWWGNRVEPRVLGLPWSLVYVLLVISLNFVVLVWCYRRGVVDATEADHPGGRR